MATRLQGIKQKKNPLLSLKMISLVLFPQALQPITLIIGLIGTPHDYYAAGSILSRTSPHRPKEMFRGESE